MRRIIIALILILLSCLPALSGRKSLLVGIGRYPAGSGWGEISSVNDVSLLKAWLQGFNITMVKDEAATHDGIIRAVRHLASQVNAGDTVLVHFSCHGQQMLTNDPSEPDHLDEALVPYDAASKKTRTYHGQNHLRDNEVGPLIRELRLKAGPRGLVIMTIDACFSDSMEKGQKKTTGRSRGGGGIFGATDKDLSAIKDLRQEEDTASLEKDPKEANIILLSACKSYQQNMEVQIDGKDYGPLSYAMATALKSCSLSDAGRWLETVRKEMDNIAYTQTPQLRTTLDIAFPGTHVTEQTEKAADEGTGSGPSYMIWLVCSISVLIVLTILFILWKKKRRLS